MSLPTFLIGILLILVFAVHAGLAAELRARRHGRVRLVDDGLLTVDGLAPLILPSITLALFQTDADHAAGARRDARGAAHRLHQFARARGLSDRAVHFGHALKNTLVPVITITGLQLGSIIAFAIITETVFQWPGMGLLFIQAVQFADIPVMAAYLCLIALIFVVINLVVDLLYFAVDPRLRVSSGGRRTLMSASTASTAARPHGGGTSARRLVAIRRDLHASRARLREAHRPRTWPRPARLAGVDGVHTGVGRTGVVGSIAAAGDPAKVARDRPARRHGRAADRRGERLRVALRGAA